MRVLIVDDSNEYRGYLRRILRQQEGLILEGEAADGEAGILLAEKLMPDVVLMDVHLPGMNGLNATRRIKEQLPQTTIIILSSDEAYRDAAANFGADAFLSKCSSISEMVAAIRRVRPSKAERPSRLVDPSKSRKSMSSVLISKTVISSAKLRPVRMHSIAIARSH